MKNKVLSKVLIGTALAFTPMLSLAYASEMSVPDEVSVPEVTQELVGESHTDSYIYLDKVEKKGDKEDPDGGKTDPDNPDKDKDGQGDKGDSGDGTDKDKSQSSDDGNSGNSGNGSNDNVKEQRHETRDVGSLDPFKGELIPKTGADHIVRAILVMILGIAITAIGVIYAVDDEEDSGELNGIFNA